MTSSLRQATQRDPGTMTPEDDYHVISTATPAPAAGSQGRSWELLLITQHSPVMAFRDTIHYWLSQWNQKGLPRGPTAFARLWREKTSEYFNSRHKLPRKPSAGSRCRSTGCVRFACLPEVACWFGARLLS